MGDPNVDLAFQNVLINYLKENYKTIFTTMTPGETLPPDGSASTSSCETSE